MVGALGEHQRSPSCADGIKNFVGDHSVPMVIMIDSLTDLLVGEALIFICFERKAKSCRAHNNLMLKRSSLCLTPTIHLVPHWAALHKKDRMMPVLACHRRGKT